MMTMVVILVLLIIFAWFVVGDEKSIGEKVTTLVIFLTVYVLYRMLNGDSFQEALIDPILKFITRSQQ